jgi:outer membrane receptor protein involved in Fe transport
LTVRHAFLIAVVVGVGLPVAAQDEVDDLDAIDAIVVTITKRAMSIEEVPATISAFSADAIRNSNIEDVSDLIALIPNAVTKGDNGAITIRGISTNFTGASAVAVHQNNVFINQYAGMFYDLESVEVVRGATGTVYGRNATAGAINYSWKKPHDTWEVFGDATLGNYDLYQFRGGVNVPFLGEGDDRLTGRFIFTNATRDEYVDLVDQPQGSSGDDYWALRGTITAKFSEDVSLDIRGFYSKSHGRATITQPIRDEQGNNLVGLFDLAALGVHPFDPGDGYQQFVQSLLTHPNSVLFAANAAVLLATDPSINSLEEGIQDGLLNGIPGFGVPAIMPNASFEPYSDYGQQQAGNSTLDRGAPRVIEEGVNGELSWFVQSLPLLGDVQVNVLGGWNRIKLRQVADTDGTQFVVIDSLSDIKTDRFTGEFRLTSENEGPYSWIAGVFYFRNRTRNQRSALVPFVDARADAFREAKGLAYFASATLRPLEILQDDPFLDLELFAGFRHNRDKEGSKARLIDDVVFHENNYEVGVRVNVFDGHNFYAKFAKGYKPGLVEQISRTPTPPALPITVITLNPVEPEILRSWEFGWRSPWLFDDRVQIGLTHFRYGYSNLQVVQLVGSQVETQNAAEASIDGVELEIRIVPTPEWNTTISAGWLDATFDSFCSDDAIEYRDGSLTDPGCTPPLVATQFNRIGNLAGNRLEDSPKFSASLISSYEFDLGELGTLTPVIEVTWTDDYFKSFYNRPAYDLVESHTRSKIRFLWRSVDERYTVELFVENLEDEIVWARTITAEIPAVATNFGMLPPRVYGIRFGFNWRSGR